jgi:KamA family protein
VIPERVTDTLLELLTQSRLQKILVLHVNHAQEIDDSVAAMAERLQSRGIWLLNQAVLLRGVNDSVEALADLSLRLIGLRIQPYYLHQLDRVAGAAHFEVPITEGRRLMTELRARLPGYAIPRYVQEIPGEPNKTVLA